MSLIITDSQNYTNIANAIRFATRGNAVYKPRNMATAILELNRNWLGKNPEFIRQVYELDTTLDETDYATWTPSTSVKTIVATQSLSQKEILDMTQYEYIIYWICDCNVAYDNTWTPAKGTCLRHLSVYTQAIFRRPTSVADTENLNLNYTATQQDSQSLSWCKYYSTASSIIVNSGAYGPCYISGVNAGTFNSTSSTTPTLTIKTPTLSARCNTTYFDVTQAAKVDQKNTTIKMIGYLYRVEKGSSMCSSIWEILLDAYNNPI